jgi:hypothetical protein
MPNTANPIGTAYDTKAMGLPKKEVPPRYNTTKTKIEANAASNPY